MKHTFGALAFILISFTNCNSQTKYFVATGIVDKTKQLVENNAEWTPIRNDEKIDGYTRIGDSIYGGEIACNISPLKGIDIETFKVYPGTKYAKDKNHVYFPLKINCVDYEDCGVCYYSTIIIDGANPSTFKYLGNDYATDGKKVFFRGNLISVADGATFKVIEGPQYFYFAVDKNYVYRTDRIFPEADPSTFYFDKSNKQNIISEFDSKYIIGDKSNKWEFSPPDKIEKISDR